MRRINPASHIPFVHVRLMKYFPKDSFASRIRKKIGGEISNVLESSEFEEDYYWEHSPVRALFEWIMKNGGISVEELEDDNGQLFDDHGDPIPNSLIRPITGVEQMAAFGLWFIDCEMGIAGPSGIGDFDEHGVNPQGWREVDLLHHKAECLFNAYQALSYAERLDRKVELSADEKASVEKFNFASLGRSGAAVRHGPMNALREYALSLYNPQDWKSANQAAHELQEQIGAYGRTINANLRPSNSQRTIVEWFRKKTV